MDNLTREKEKENGDVLTSRIDFSADEAQAVARAKVGARDKEGVNDNKKGREILELFVATANDNTEDAGGEEADGHCLFAANSKL